MDILLYVLASIFALAALFILIFTVSALRGKPVTISFWYIVACPASYFTMINLPNWKGWSALLGIG